MATTQPRRDLTTLDLDALTPEQAWEIWKPVSDEVMRRFAAGERERASVRIVAEELGIPLEIGAIAAAGDEDQEAEAREWTNAYLGDDVP